MTKPAVVRETIRPIEKNIITTNTIVHHHVHHYVHRIQPVTVTSIEAEGHVHNILDEGKERFGTGLYRERQEGDVVAVSDGMNGCSICGATGNILSGQRRLKIGENEEISSNTCPACGGNIENDLSAGIRDMKIT